MKKLYGRQPIETLDYQTNAINSPQFDGALTVTSATTLTKEESDVITVSNGGKLSQNSTAWPNHQIPGWWSGGE